MYFNTVISVQFAERHQVLCTVVSAYTGSGYSGFPHITDKMPGPNSLHSLCNQICPHIPDQIPVITDFFVQN